MHTEESFKIPSPITTTIWKTDSLGATCYRDNVRNIPAINKSLNIKDYRDLLKFYLAQIKGSYISYRQWQLKYEGWILESLQAPVDSLRLWTSLKKCAIRVSIIAFAVAIGEYYGVDSTDLFYITRKLPCSNLYNQYQISILDKNFDNSEVTQHLETLIEFSKSFE